MFCGAAIGYSRTREPQAERRREPDALGNTKRIAVKLFLFVAPPSGMALLPALNVAWAEPPVTLRFPLSVMAPPAVTVQGKPAW